MRDLLAAAGHLIESGVTGPDKLGIVGFSHGGMLVGASIAKAPQMFRAAVAFAGMFDLLRCERILRKPYLNRAAVSLREFGSPSHDLDFERICGYSPLQHVREKTDYPATLLVTGTSDDRVPPPHSYKFAAALQYSQAAAGPILLSPIDNAGHLGFTGAGWETFACQMISFFCHELGLPLPR